MNYWVHKLLYQLRERLPHSMPDKPGTEPAIDMLSLSDVVVVELTDDVGMMIKQWPGRWPILEEMWPRNRRAWSLMEQWPHGSNYCQILRRDCRSLTIRYELEAMLDEMEVIIQHGVKEHDEATMRTATAGLAELGLEARQAQLRFLRPITLQLDEITNKHQIYCEFMVAPAPYDPATATYGR